MKNIGIVYGYRKGLWIKHKTDTLLNLLGEAFAERGFGVQKVGLEDLRVIIKGNKLKIIDAITKKDLKELAGLYMANYRVNPEMAMCVYTYLKRHGIETINPEIGRFLPLTKLGEMALMADQKIPMPDSVFMRHKHLKRAIAKQKLPFEFPFIAKAINGSMGASNWLIKSYDELSAAIDEIPDSTLVLQEFIPNDFDYRVLVFGGEVKLVIKRSRVDDSTHVNNTSMGGLGELLDVYTFPQDLVDLSLKAAKAVGRLDISGVDIIIDSVTGKPYVLEVNKSPQIETGSNVAVKTAAFVDYAINKIEGHVKAI